MAVTRLRTHALFRAVTRVLLPRRCLSCSRSLLGAPLCTRCLPTTVVQTFEERCPRCFTPWMGGAPGERCGLCREYGGGWHTMRYLVDYTPHIRTLLHLVKYRPSITLARVVANHLAQSIPELFPQSPSWDAIVPLPSSGEGLGRRSFAVPDLFARAVRRSLPDPSLPILPDVLIPCRYHTPHARIPLAERPRRARSLFAPVNDPRVAGAHVLLIDDLITTGASVEAAARALHRAGASRIDILAWARSPHWCTFRAATTHRR